MGLLGGCNWVKLGYFKLFPFHSFWVKIPKYFIQLLQDSDYEKVALYWRHHVYCGATVYCWILPYNKTLGVFLCWHLRSLVHIWVCHWMFWRKSDQMSTATDSIFMFCQNLSLSISTFQVFHCMFWPRTKSPKTGASICSPAKSCLFKVKEHFEQLNPPDRVLCM